MKQGFWAMMCVVMTTAIASAQDFDPVFNNHGFIGAGSVGSSEPLFRYDDQERWKHGYLQIMPFYGGHFAFRPYNYHHVFSQSQTAAGWGMPATMPYSQQFWHRYEKMADLSRGDHSPVVPVEPPPSQFDHYPKPLYNGPRQTPVPPPYPSSTSIQAPMGTGIVATPGMPYGGEPRFHHMQHTAPPTYPQQYEQSQIVPAGSYFSSGPSPVGGSPTGTDPLSGPALVPRGYHPGTMQHYFSHGR